MPQPPSSGAACPPTHVSTQACLRMCLCTCAHTCLTHRSMVVDVADSLECLDGLPSPHEPRACTSRCPLPRTEGADAASATPTGPDARAMSEGRRLETELADADADRGMSIHMPMHMSMHISTHMSTYMSTHMSIHMSKRMSLHMSERMSTHRGSQARRCRWRRRRHGGYRVGHSGMWHRRCCMQPEWAVSVQCNVQWGR